MSVSNPTFTALFVVAVLLLAGLLDGFLALSGGTTITAIVRGWRAQWPWLRWLILALGCHLAFD